MSKNNDHDMMRQVSNAIYLLAIYRCLIRPDVSRKEIVQMADNLFMENLGVSEKQFKKIKKKLSGH